MTSPPVGEVRKRFYVGNLPEAVSEIDLNKLFGKYGKVAQSEVKTKKDIDCAVKNTFGFVTVVLAHEAKASEVIRECSNLKWKKHVIKVQVAQESFMDRLKKERNDPSNKTKNVDENYDPLAMMRGQVKQTSSADEPTPPSKPPQSPKPSTDRPGVVEFEPEEPVSKPVKRRVYDSSDDEDETPIKRSRQPPANSLSSVVGQKSFKGSSGFLSKLENDSFWNDEGETKDEEQPKNAKSWMNKDFANKLSDSKPFSFTKTAEVDSDKPSQFSFLSKFGGEKAQPASDVTVAKPGKQSNVFQYEDSDEDEVETRPKLPASARLLNRLAKPMSQDAKFGLQLKEKAAVAAAAAAGDTTEAKAEVGEPFFFSPGDERLAEGLQFVSGRRDGQTMDQIRENFEEQRPKLAHILKKKMRSKAKKQELRSFGGKRKGGKAFTKRGGGKKPTKRVESKTDQT